MAEAIAAADAARNFEIVIISDSTNVDAWIAETLAIDCLRRALNGAASALHGLDNTACRQHRDFIKHWGAHLIRSC
jgi:membrane glycosyltransferase